MSYGPVLASLGVGAISSLFGRKKTNPYADQLNQTATDLGNLRNGYQGEITNGDQGYKTYDPRYRSAVDAYGNYLATDPYTDQYSTRVIGQATAGTNAAFDAARSNLQADLARRGISGSSVDAGTTGALEAARASDISGAQNDLALRKTASQQARLAALTDLYGGVANNYRSTADAGRMAQGQLTGEMAGIYQGLNASGNNEANLENSQQDAALSAAAGAIGQYAGRDRSFSVDDTSGNPEGYTMQDALNAQIARESEKYGPPSPGPGDTRSAFNTGDFTDYGGGGGRRRYSNPGSLYNLFASTKGHG